MIVQIRIIQAIIGINLYLDVNQMKKAYINITCLLYTEHVCAKYTYRGIHTK
ncbi:hypothetical protein ANS017_17210 [Paraclostridium bifermentans]|nr:hypothetical protein ANS014_14940 [Paraclostridium bifermentans]GKZ07321.1 hypothetical protein ANS015_22040 [Paraclostridium bifermentans]GKZ10337.1 hypothetical protein ANS017_17210 [Paraclostridium bifermentans]